MNNAEHILCFSNPGPHVLRVWLEPWADEFEVPARSTITFEPSRQGESCPLGELETTADHLVIWADAERVAVLIDGVPQTCSSAVVPVPSGLNKRMLGIVFANHPPARLAGSSNAAARKSLWWAKLLRRLGLNSAP